MNILLTNDDGYQADGIRAAYDAMRSHGEVFVVAPLTERSACSHAITLRSPITVQRVDDRQMGTVYAVEGTPADCVRLGVSALLDVRIDLVVSGINRGANVGVDTFYSGTVAGAREGAILEITSIALSQAIRRDVETDWDRTGEVAAELVGTLLKESLPGAGLWSVNFPAPIPDDALDRVRRVPIDGHPMPMSFDRKTGDDGRTIEFEYGDTYWLREVTAPCDFATIRDGEIAVTAIALFGKF